LSETAERRATRLNLSPHRLLWGSVACLYLISFPYHPALRSPNELSRLWLARSVVDHRSLAIDQTLQEFGAVGDLSCTLTVVNANGQRALHSCVEPVEASLQVIERHYYSSKAPLLSMLAAPVYAAQKVFGPANELLQVYLTRLLLGVAPTLLLLVFMRRFLHEFVDEFCADIVTFAYALGSMAFSHATSVMSHQLTAVLVFATLFFSIRGVRGHRPRRSFVLAGFFAGATVACEYTGVLFVLPVATFVLLSLWADKRRLLEAVALVLLGSGPPLLALMSYHWVCFGHPLVSGYKFLNDAAYQPWHLGGFLGIRYPDIRALGLSFFSPLRGFFALSPFWALALVGLWPLKVRNRPLFVATIVAILGSVYFTSSFSYDSWGWTVGPRHLTGLLPLLVLPVALGLSGLQAPRLRAMAVGLCLSSVAASSLVEYVNYVPPELSTSLFGLAVPLLLDGVYPVTVLAVLLPNPWSGLIWLAVLTIAIGGAGWLLQKAQLSLRWVVLAAAMHLSLLALLTRNDEADKGARAFVKSAWSAVNGTRLHFW
jgi:hypothetical protein